MNKEKKALDIIKKTLNKIPHKFVLIQVILITVIILSVIIFINSMHNNEINAIDMSNNKKVAEFINNLKTSCDILDYQWYDVSGINEVEIKSDDINKWCKIRFIIYNRNIDGVYEIYGEHRPLEYITFEDNESIEKPYRDNINNFIDNYSNVKTKLEEYNISNAVYITPQAKNKTEQYKYIAIAYAPSISVLNDLLENEDIVDDNISIIFTNSAIEYSNIESNFSKANILYVEKYFDDSEHYRVDDVLDNDVEFDKVFNKVALSEIEEYSKVLSDSNENHFDITDDIWVVTVTKNKGAYSNDVYVSTF